MPKLGCRVDLLVYALRLAGDLPTQDRDLMPQHKKLCILRGVTTRQQHQPAQRLGEEQIDETNVPPGWMLHFASGGVIHEYRLVT